MFLFSPSASREKNPISPGDPVAELVARAQGGDIEAFDRLVERFQNRVYNLCLWQLGDADEAADAAQDAFVRAWRALPKFRGDCAFSTWMHRIAVNVARDAQSRRRQAPVAFSTLSGDQEPDFAERAPDDPNTRPAETAQRAERRRAVRRALGEMPPHHRLVLVLFDIEGHSYDQVATILKLPMGTVKSRLNRARAALRDKLQECRELFED